MVEFTKGNIPMIKNMAMECLLGLMEEDMRVCGEMESKLRRAIVE
jgi:hypothetical protein